MSCPSGAAIVAGRSCDAGLMLAGPGRVGGGAAGLWPGDYGLVSGRAGDLAAVGEGRGLSVSQRPWVASEQPLGLGPASLSLVLFLPEFF